MGIKINVDREKQEVHVLQNDVIIETLKGSDARRFLKDTKEEVEENLFFFQPIKKITIEDIEELGCPIDDLEGLLFEATVYTRCFPEAHLSVDVIRNGKCIDSIYLDDFFTTEQLYFGPITNHHIRACLDEELIEHILDQPKFRMGIDTLYHIFDEENTYHYTAEESSDT